MKKAVCAMVIVVCAAFANLHAQTAGTFPVIFNNLANNTYADSQIYIYSLGMYGGQWCYMTKDGTMLPMNPADATAAGHLTKNGVNYANYAFRLSDAGNFRIPQSVGGGRLYISCGGPMYIPVYSNGWAGPDPNNSGDPNDSLYYDWFEYTYIYNQLQFGGNTTQVDIFGFPYTARVVQSSTNFDDSCGINMARDSVIQRFKNEMSAPFQDCIRPCRVVAPRSSSQFGTGGAYADYMKTYVDSLWTLWAITPLSFYNGTNHYIGTVDVNGVLQFTGAETGSMTKPTSQAIFACAGFPGYVGAALSAAFNRGVARIGADFYDPTTYYKVSNYKNEFAQVLHEISIHNKAYGFGYDDNNNQSSVLIVGSSQPLTSLTFTIEPFVTPPNVATVVPEHKSVGSLPGIRLISGNRIFLDNPNQIAEVTIVSASGKTVLRNVDVSAGNRVISTPELAGGIYYVRITDKQGSISTSRIALSGGGIF